MGTGRETQKMGSVSKHGKKVDKYILEKPFETEPAQWDAALHTALSSEQTQHS